MDIVGDMEIIKMALFMGDLKDAMSKIDHTMKKMRRKYDMNHKEIFLFYQNLLQDLRDVLEGKKDPFSLREILQDSRIKPFNTEMDMKVYADSTVFFINYCIDRYNVTYPRYDSKRCNDL